jgi:hypothetical protein
MRIYVAGPYSHPDPEQRERHVQQAIRAGRELLRQGHAPFIPHLAHAFDQWCIEQGCPLSYEAYMRWDAAFLTQCEGLLLLGSSPGADREVELAVRLGIPVLSRLALNGGASS